MTRDAQLSSAPFIEEYFCIWALQPEIAVALHNSFRVMDLGAHLQNNAERVTLDLEAIDAEARHESGRRSTASFDVIQDVAVIPIHGTLMKQASSFSRGSSTVQIRRQVRAAAADPSIKAIFLHVESPGGAVPGTAELADDVLAARDKKPVHAFIEDVGASAAFWIAAQANFISANRMAFVGSIGTFAGLHDLSKMADKMGIEVVLFKAGEFKAAGFPGTVVTPEQREMFQNRINMINDQFLAGLVKSGRFTKKEAKELNDGRALIASEALKVNMIDKVETFDQALSRVIKASRSKSRARAELGSASLQIGEHVLSLGPAQAELIGKLKDHSSWPDSWNITKQSELIEQSDQDEADQSGPVSEDTTQPEPGDSLMSETTAKVEIKDLRQACEGASDSFILGQLEAGSTIEEAKSAHIKEVQKANASLETKLKEANDGKAKAETEKAELEAASKKKKKGLEVVGDDNAGQGSGDPGIEWNKLVKQEMKDSACDRQAACSNVNIEHPGLRESMIDAHNEKHNPRRKR